MYKHRMEKDSKLNRLVNFRCTKPEREAWLAVTEKRGGLSKTIRAHLNRLVATEAKRNDNERHQSSQN